MGKRKGCRTVKKIPKRLRCNSSGSSEYDLTQESEDQTTLSQLSSSQDQSLPSLDFLTNQVDDEEIFPKPSSLEHSDEKASTSQHASTNVAKTTEQRNTEVLHTLLPDKDIEATAEDPNLQEQEQISTTAVEVIDVDKLPDIPDSSIGDDVIEITVPTQERKESGSSSTTTTTTTPQFVDLTSLSDHSPVNEEANVDSRVPAVPPDPVIPGLGGELGSEDEEEQDMPPVLFTKKEEVATTSSQKDSLNTTTITCPVCQDGLNQIKNDSRKLMSTVCGHIFCDACVRQAVETQKKCPTCRRRLNKSQFHPIFI